MRKIILASASPRRRDLLSKIGLEFEVIPSNYDEKLGNDNFTYEKIENLALNKAKDVEARIDEDALIIAADTVVVLDGKILGKPHTKQEAREMISALSGRIHEVITAIAMVDKTSQKTIVHSNTTKVKFRKISEEEVERYISTDEPYDKAGGYAAQGLAAIFIGKIDGCFNNVVGISLFEVDKMLKKMNYNYGLSR